ncbi:MAG: hypothetical protein ACTS46_01075 [Candidatus Hodgkinia cicadicola]
MLTSSNFAMFAKCSSGTKLVLLKQSSSIQISNFQVGMIPHFISAES